MKLKPLMDAYHAPYKEHTRYWTGLLLLIRVGLFFTFAINSLGSESINILVISFVAIALLALPVGKVYQCWWNDLLERSLILNLSIFSFATFIVTKKEFKDDQLTLSSISVGTASLTFVGIFLFMFILPLKSTGLWKVHMHPYIHKNQLLNRILSSRITLHNEHDSTQKSTEIHSMSTSSVVDVDLREPLIDATCY